MRALRVLLAAALIVPAALVAGGTVAEATPGTYTVFTASGTPNVPVALYADSTNPGLQFTASDPASEIDVNLAAPASGGYPTTLVIAPYAGDSLAVGTFPTYPNASESGQVGLNLDELDACASPGSIDILQLDTDSGTGDITAFAADYSLPCDGTTYTGQVRWNSDIPDQALSYTPAGWDFGTQLIKENGPQRTFTITNHGQSAQSFQALAFSGTSGIYTATLNTCSNKSIASGASCQITVIAHPKAAGSDYASTMSLKASGRPAVTIPLSVLGSSTVPFYTTPGAAKITLDWGYVGVPFYDTALDLVSSYDIYRGTSATSLSFLARTQAYAYSYTDTKIATGKPYYYEIRPELDNGSTTPPTPVIAAEAWPKYASGMYHRLSTPVRLISGHVVTAGHPYTVKLEGQHGIATSNVSAVALDLEIAKPSKTTSAWVYPAGSKQPSAPDLYVTPGTTRTNFVLANLGKGGAVTISLSHGSAPVYVDLSGYFSAAGLSSSHGEGGTLQVYASPETILDTKAWKIGALKHDYYVDVPADFAPVQTPHVTSLVVEVTAYDSSGSGTIAGYASPGSGAVPATSVLAYSPGVTTSNTAIIKTGLVYDSENGYQYPSVSFLNRGTSSVQLVVSILGFIDDNNFFIYGARYVPTAPVHLFAKSLGNNATSSFKAGTHGDIWTAAFNLKMAAYTPTATTSLSLSATGFGPAPKYGQLHVRAHVTGIGTTLDTVGLGNEVSVHNSAGTADVSLWSDGRFEENPQPDASWYSNGDTVSAPPRGMESLIRVRALAR